jgi:hypothetical protein
LGPKGKKYSWPEGRKSSDYPGRPITYAVDVAITRFGEKFKVPRPKGKTHIEGIQKQVLISDS